MNFHKQNLMANAKFHSICYVAVIAGKLHHSAHFTESGLSVFEIVTTYLKLFRMEQITCLTDYALSPSL